MNATTTIYEKPTSETEVTRIAYRLEAPDGHASAKLNISIADVPADPTQPFTLSDIETETLKGTTAVRAYNQAVMRLLKEGYTIVHTSCEVGR